MVGSGLDALIRTISERITDFSENRGHSIDITADSAIIGGGPGWKMIVETSAYGRIMVYSSGTSAFVGMRTRGDGNFTYVLGKMSPYITFPLEKIYEGLNRAEHLTSTHNSWGGSNTIGGSPRHTGSRLSPKEVERIINDIVSDSSQG